MIAGFTTELAAIPVFDDGGKWAWGNQKCIHFGQIPNLQLLPTLYKMLTLSSWKEWINCSTEISMFISSTMF
jgi:hypothetical protein